MDSTSIGNTITEKRFLFVAGIESILEFSDKTSIKKKAPKISLMVAPFGLPFLPIEVVSSDVGSLIQTVSYTKSRSMPGATVSITLAADRRALDGIFKDVFFGTLKTILFDSTAPDITDLFKPMTMVQLWVDGYCMLTGIVRSSSRSASPTSSTIYTVNIDELGMLYNQNVVSFPTIYYGQDLYMKDDPSKMLILGQTQVATPLPEAIRSLIQAHLMSSMLYGIRVAPPYFKMSDGLPLIYRMIAYPPPIGAVSANSLVKFAVTESNMFEAASGGSFWDYLKSLCPEPFMELFTESGGRTIVTGRMASMGINITPMLPGFNYVVARTTPYEIPWTGITPWLPTLYPFMCGAIDLLLGGDFIMISDDDVISKNLGMSDAQQFTLFYANYGGRSGSNAPTVKNRPSLARGPLNPLYGGGVKTFGVREYQGQISSTGLSHQGLLGQSMETFRRKRPSGTDVLHVPALATLLNTWFRNAAKFREGTIQVRGMGYVRPGMFLLYVPSPAGSKVDNLRDLGIYYIDNVQYEYHIGKADVTTLSVIRGTPMPISAESFISLLYDWEVLPPGMNLWDGGL